MGGLGTVGGGVFSEVPGASVDGFGSELELKIQPVIKRQQSRLAVANNFISKNFKLSIRLLSKSYRISRNTYGEFCTHYRNCNIKLQGPKPVLPLVASQVLNRITER